MRRKKRSKPGRENPFVAPVLSTSHTTNNTPSNKRQNGTWLYFFALRVDADFPPADNGLVEIVSQECVLKISTRNLTCHFVSDMKRFQFQTQKTSGRDNMSRSLRRQSATKK